MRVLITGATGFIGTELAARLVARGDTVRALVRSTSRTGDLSAIGVVLARGDISDVRSLAAAIEGCDVVFHVAGAVKALTYEELVRANVEGTRNVAIACAAAATPPVLVYVSSLAAAGPAAAGHPRTEDDAPAPVSRYGESKLAGEEAIRDVCHRVEASVLRPPIVYGPRDKEVMPQLLRMARLGVVVRAGPQKEYSVVHVADLCDALIAAAVRGRRIGRSGSDGIYFVDDGRVHSWDEIALAACAAWGRRARVVAVPEVATFLVAAGSSVLATLTGTPSILSFDKIKEVRQAAWTCSSDRAARELGFVPRFPLAQGMSDAVAWFRRNGA